MFLRSQDAPAVMPWNLVAKYDPDQPRAEDGKWTDGGGGERSAQDIIAIAKAIKKIKDTVGEYKAYGGTTEILSSADAPAVRAELEALEEAARTHEPSFPADYSEERFSFTDSAIGGAQTGLRVYLGRDEDAGGLITGAMSVNTAEEGVWTIVSAGATGILPGAGTAMFADIFRDAADAGVGLYLLSTGAGIKFYRSVGMTQGDFMEFEASAQRVRDIAEGI